MPILEAMQSATARLVGRRPTSFFSSTETLEIEITDLVTDVAVDLMKAHDWRKLTKLNTITGDGTTIAWSLPADFDRMILAADIHSANFATWRYTPSPSLDHWRDIQDGLAVLNPGFWILLEGQMQIYPPVPTGEFAKFYYVSSYIASGKAAFNSDADEFLLGNRLLTLGLIWRWRSQKRMEYSEDLQNYEIAVEQEIARDRGSQLLRPGNRNHNWNVREAYPGNLGS